MTPGEAAGVAGIVVASVNALATIGLAFTVLGYMRATQSEHGRRLEDHDATIATHTRDLAEHGAQLAALDERTARGGGP